MIWLAILFVLVVIVMGLIGGQKEKGVRRFGIPGLAFILSIGKFSWRNIGILGLMGILSIGYGENSWLMDIFHNDILVRVAYGTMLSIPFFLFGIKRGLVALALLIGAFQIRAGSLFSIGTFDVLIEDIVRYGALGITLAFIIFRKN